MLSTRSDPAAMKVTTAPAGLVASTVMFVGTVTTGGVVSTTVTLNAPNDRLPAASIAEQLTVCVPSANVEPDAGTQLTGIGPSTLSTAVAMKDASAPVGPVASRVRLAGRLRTG